MRDSELHLGSLSEIRLSSEVIENVLTEKIKKDILKKHKVIYHI